MSMTAGNLTLETSAAPALTYAQYLAEGTISRRYEILDGVRRWMPHPAVRHQDVLFNIAAAFKTFSRTSGAGRMVVAACDVLFISRERFGDRDPLDPSALDPAPELVVEVLSPSDTRVVPAGKLHDYRRVQVRECWIVSLDAQTVEVLRLTPDAEASLSVFSGTDLVRSTVFPGLSVPLTDIFAV